MSIRPRGPKSVWSSRGGHGGYAKVSNRAQYRRFLRRCFRRNPAGTFGYLWAAEWNYVILPWMRDRLEKLGVKPVLKWIYGRLVGSPVRS